MTAALDTKTVKYVFIEHKNISKQFSQLLVLSSRHVRYASLRFSIEMADRPDFTHMIARPSINKDIKIGK